MTGGAALPSVSVCFPAYNEEATVAYALREADALLKNSDLDYEILVCDDGSEDGTGAIISELAGSIARMTALRNERNQGIRDTFERLYRTARKDLVFLNATDGQWPTKCLFEMLPLIGEWDIVVASRRDKHYGPVRAIVSWANNWIPKVFFGVRTFDAGSVKLMRREIIEGLPILSKSTFSEAERLIRAARSGYRITEVPVDTAPRRTGVAHGVSFGAVMAACVDALRVWRALRKTDA
jgi:glycosyltransferase involved in cell wall biosynthesis